MKAILLIVLSLSALAYAGPFSKNTENQITADKNLQAQQQLHAGTTDVKNTQTIETLKQWCFASQMSQNELTGSFKKLVSLVKSQPEDQSTEAAVMNERICQGAVVQKSSQTGETLANNGADTQAHELIKDVYMDALISCNKRECTKQLLKIVNSNKVDAVRASYYMTRLAVAEQDTVKDEQEVKQMAESFVSERDQPTSEMVERQKLFAITSMLAKSLKNTQKNGQVSQQLKQASEEVVKTIIERYIKPISKSEVAKYISEEPAQQSEQTAKKIAKGNAALRALANIPGWQLQQIEGVEDILTDIATNKQELLTTRQSAIECLEENSNAHKVLKQICFDQEEPIEVRVAAYRALMTVAFSEAKDEQTKQQLGSQIVDEIVKHCERNQQSDDQFCLYCISHLDNLRTSQQPEHKSIKEAIAKNKQHYMQIQLMVNKLKRELSDIRKSSRNYKLAQEFAQLESGLIIEGDIVYESKQRQQQQQQPQVLPKMVRVNMSMPVMGETVNVVEITVRQNHMDEELLGALKLIKGAKLNSESMSKVVGQFRSSVEEQQQKQQQQQQRYQGTSQQERKSPEADLTIKVEGCTIVYICADDFKSTTSNSNKRYTRSLHSESLVDELIESLKRKPISFNRGFNFNLNERLAKVLDVDANLVAGLAFEGRAQGHSNDYELVLKAEPRVAYEAIVGPAKLSDKKLLQRFSTKTAVALRLRYKRNELVDVQLDLPMNTMELFSFENQLVEKSSRVPHSYTYLADSIYGQEDIYTPTIYETEDIYANVDTYGNRKFGGISKRSVFAGKKSSYFGKSYKSYKSFAQTIETPEEIARATGLRGKIRVAASTKDASLVLQCIVQKYDSRMQGYRFHVQKVARGQEQQQYVLSVSTPGYSSRPLQVRFVKQSTGQRTLIKSDIESPMVSAMGVFEVIHDGRQFAIKSELASTKQQQRNWRHSAEFGFQRSSGAQGGRQAITYKPYVSIESTQLRRPLQLQGVLSVSEQSPKTVIVYELKCPTSGDFVQGKFIVASERPAYLGKRDYRVRRSMSSPVELMLERELTLSGEFVGQVRQHAVKVHKMLDWSPSKVAIKADLSAVHKNLRKSTEDQIVAALKVDAEQQMLTCERKCPQDSRKEFRFTVASELRSPSQHQMLCELRYHSDRRSSQQQVIAYKHKLDYTKMSPKAIEFAFNTEIIDTLHQINEKFAGRTQVAIERRMKTLKAEVSSRDKQAKIDFDFVSLGEHELKVNVHTERIQHRCQMLANKQKFAIQSYTDKDRQTLAKVVLEVAKSYEQPECQLLVEVPKKNTHVALDLKFAPGKLSSMAVQTERFASKAEFSFEKFARASMFRKPFGGNYRFKTDLKDLAKREQYWLESNWNGQMEDKSYLRMNSPVYRTDFEFDPQELSTKFGMFARSKRSIYANNYEDNEQQQLYSNEDSLLNTFGQRLFDLNKDKSGKMWMLRSMVSSPRRVEELKQKALRALFEYADQREQHKHEFNWSPLDERVNFHLERQPIESELKPLRLTGDLYTSAKKPSRVNMESELFDLELDAEPFGSEQKYARVSALSRHPRSPFKKHESEIRYQKGQGYKGYVKHEDQKSRKHQMRMEADESPKKFARMTYESDKHGKGQWEHQWRKQLNKRDQHDYYTNKMAYRAESPRSGDWQHASSVEWVEPARLVDSSAYMRFRRSPEDYAIVAEAAKRQRYSPIEYLKQVNARVNSNTMRAGQQLYNVDFDYKPEQTRAALKVEMPDEMLHSSVFEFEPTERLYKVQSKLYNQRTNEPTYQFAAATKPLVAGVASGEQEPVYVHETHPMLEQPIDSTRLLTKMFKQPLKLDYSDRQGRVASFDYDYSPIVATKYAGLRQKRAAIYYKHDDADIEHSTKFDFYPESFLGKFKRPSKDIDYEGRARVPADILVNTHTKYGPIVIRADNTDQDSTQVEIISPVVNAKLTSETSKRSSGAQLIKIKLDNKQQKVQLAKLVRKTPVLKELSIVDKIARHMDANTIEHQTECLVSLVEAIFKLKSQTLVDARPELLVEAELNRQQEKLFVKVDGKRVKGQSVVDVARKMATLVLDVDDKRTLSHQTRLVRVSDKFYSLDSTTTYKQEPLVKVSGKVSAMIFSEPAHLFARRRSGFSGEEHKSTLEAIVYQPKPLQMSAQYDCLNKEARVVFKNEREQRIQETKVKFDEQTENILVDSRLTAPYGTVYTTKAKINLPGLMQSYKCQRQQYSCASEIYYQSAKSGSNAIKYYPHDHIEFITPRNKQIINLAY